MGKPNKEKTANGKKKRVENYFSSSNSSTGVLISP